jgi:hypothetical protein
MLQHHVWHLNKSVRGILVATEDPTASTCDDFKQTMSYITSDMPNYNLGDKICDEGREWVCRSDELCRLSPYASWLDQLNAWEITNT